MKNFFVLTVAAVMAVTFTSCKNDDPKPVPTVAVTGVTLDATSKTLDIGGTVTLKETVAPADATNKNVSWSTSDAKVATVSSGVVTAVAEGTATITVTTADGNKTAVCTVTVAPPAITIAGAGIGEALEIKASQSLPTPTVPVVVNIAAGEGIENFKVQITSSSAVFTGSLTAIGLAGEFDLANPGPLAAAFAGLAESGVALPYGDEVKGKTEREFNITAFVPMIFGLRTTAGETGDCTAEFKLTVVDTKGSSAEAAVKLNLIDDIPAAE